MSTETARTKILLDLLLEQLSKEAAEEADNSNHGGRCPRCGTHSVEMCDCEQEAAGMKLREMVFKYASSKSSKLQDWTVDPARAWFFLFKNTPYMVIRGPWSCITFNLNRAYYAKTGHKIGLMGIHHTEVNHWPTEGEFELNLQ